METWLARFDSYSIAIIAVSALLLVLAGPLVRWLTQDSSIKRIHTLRIINFLIIVLVVVRVMFPETVGGGWPLRIINALLICYFAILFAQIVIFLLRKRLGRTREVQGELRMVDTYASRGSGLLAIFIISVAAAVGILQALGLDSLLQTGSALGVLGIMLAMTQASWAPDLISGLIILNSRLCEEGDVVQIHVGTPRTATVFRTKFFHTEFLDLANNHRLMMRNATVRDSVIDNLSRFASARGLRECLQFNIGYEHSPKAVREMIKDALKIIDTETESREEQFEPQVEVMETGNDAVTWGVFYYTKDVKNILSFRRLVNEKILETSIRHGISLATPRLHDAKVNNG